MDRRDIHVLKYFSSYVSVSEGKVINITEPTLIFCPLAENLYKNFKDLGSHNKEAVKAAIKDAIESKIKDYGFFTEKRKFSFGEVSIPYGASEMLSFALRKKAVDAAVVVCEGAGTVITNNPDMVQAIGARMHSLLLTSPIKGIIEKLKAAGCRVIFENAFIDQARGVEEAIRSGYKSIAVTVCGHSAEDLKRLRLLEKENNAAIVILSVCTTGLPKDKVSLIRDYADLVWSCASSEVRQIIGPSSIMQLSRQIPVFVLTRQGVNFIAAYANDEKLIRDLDARKQYLSSNEPSGQCVYFGNLKTFICESILPVNARREPRFEEKNQYASV